MLLFSEDWFVNVPSFLLLLIMAASLAALGKGADWLVDGASRLAFRMGMPKVIVGATVVSLGTTCPEATVSVMAAWEGKPDLALGNAVGSVIADTGLIFGVGCLLTVLPADRFVLRRQGWAQFGCGMGLALLCYTEFLIHGDEAEIGQLEGLFFLVLLAIYLAMSVRWARARKRQAQGTPEAIELEETEGAATNLRRILFLLGKLALGLVVVVFASRFLIGSASQLAKNMGVPPVVIAATLVAFGTSLPELAVGIASIRRKHPELLVGNVIGADILNVLFVTGASAAAAGLPIVERDFEAQVAHIFLWVHLPTMLVVLVLFRSFVSFAISKGQFRRWFGWPLLAVYIVYVGLQYKLSLG